MGDETKLLQFAPFSSGVDAGFWYQLSKQKLEVYKLDDEAVRICGFYTNTGASGLPPIANIDYTSFNEGLQVPPRCFPLAGTLINTNTVEDFKEKDKKQLIQAAGEEIWKSIVSGEALNDPLLLLRFTILTFADLKKYHYYYWVAFPALCYPESICLQLPTKLHDYFNDEQVMQFLQSYDSLPTLSDKAFFIVHISSSDTVSVLKLNQFSSEKLNSGKVLLGFADPSTMESNPGWPLRNFLSLAAFHWSKDKTSWEVLCFRECIKDGSRLCGHSVIFSIKIKESDAPQECPKTVGWEKNKGKLVPRMVNMSATMDPNKLAESAVDLNLKLMKWRLVPDIDLDAVINTKCLLLGSGTLGCNVARCLLGWGVRKITMVDNSTVSYSNPVRQSLFTFDDCLSGGKPKAKAAAEALKKIFPGVDAEGCCLNVPMPGHALTQNTIETTRSEVLKLEELVDSHDVIFLLMDTRESRWLPTVIGAAKGKLVINAALGYDTFLVVRHGLKTPESDLAKGDAALPRHMIPGNNLGCYFCNDVVAPGNSTRDRTLDQQCTVTRPGISYVTAALAVELMVSILQHPERGRAPADTTARDEHLSAEYATPLGIVPHQIRGYLSRFHNILPGSKAFERCIACSSTVVDKYKEEGFEFLLKVFNEPDYLEDLTGLTELHENINMDDVWALSDEDSS